MAAFILSTCSQMAQAQSMSARGIGSSSTEATFDRCAQRAPSVKQRALLIERRIQIILNCHNQGQLYDPQQDVCIMPDFSPNHRFTSRPYGDTLVLQNPDGTWGEEVTLGGNVGGSVTCVEQPVAVSPVAAPPVSAAPPPITPPSTKPPACSSDEGRSCCPYTSCSSNGTVQCNGSCSGAVEQPACAASTGGSCCPYDACSSNGTVQCNGSCAGAVEDTGPPCRTITICPPICVPGPHGECQSEEPGPCHSFEICD